jgi:hypothetical protein
MDRKIREHKQSLGVEGLSTDEVVRGDLAHKSAQHAIARIEQVMNDLAGVAENVIADCDL